HPAQARPCVAIANSDPKRSPLARQRDQAWPRSTPETNELGDESVDATKAVVEVVLQVSGSSPATVRGRGGGWEGDDAPPRSTTTIPTDRCPPPSLPPSRTPGKEPLMVTGRKPGREILSASPTQAWGDA